MCGLLINRFSSCCFHSKYSGSCGKGHGRCASQRPSNWLYILIEYTDILSSDDSFCSLMLSVSVVLMFLVLLLMSQSVRVGLLLSFGIV